MNKNNTTLQDLPFGPCVDLLVTVTQASPNDALQAHGTSNRKEAMMLESCITKFLRLRQNPIVQTRQQATPPPTTMTVKLILAPRGGYLVRNDILNIRLLHSPWIESIACLSAADGYYAPYIPEMDSDLLTLLTSSPAALLLADTLATNYPRTLDDDLKMRLSFDWMLTEAPPRRVVAMVGGRTIHDKKNNLYGYRGSFEAAEALNIAVIVLDRPGHWLEAEESAHLRSAFVPIDMTLDQDLPSRIVNAVKDLPIDAIVSFGDDLIGPTAKAAELLGLPTDPVSAYAASLDKHTTSNLFNNVQIVRLDDAQQLLDASMAARLQALRFPVIVKPCRAGGSRGVMKVNDWANLQQAIAQVDHWGYAKQGILVETYIDGPEIDANFALWKGEIVWFELCDDFPCDADAEDATILDTFAEDIMVMPSTLPTQEKLLLKKTLHKQLLELGFHSGVFHVEARVRNSRMRYRKTEGILDLEAVDDSTSPTAAPEVFLVEINARPAGFDNIYGIQYAYGVDFNALHWLRCLEDGERFAALSVPFTCETQYISCILNTPIHGNRTMRIPEDYCAQVLARVPHVAPHVSAAECFTAGQTVARVGGSGHIGYFVVYSWTGRKDLLRMCEDIRVASKHVVEGAGSAVVQ